MSISARLERALALELQGHGTRRLQESYSAISARYHEGPASLEASAPIRSTADALSYAAARMPATYGACEASMRAVANRVPAFEPRTMLDLGAGPGSTFFAAKSVWPSLSEVTALESSVAMKQLGMALLTRTSLTDELSVTYVTMDLRSFDISERFDLVVGSYVLGELTDANRAVLIANAWTATGRTLLFVEPGTTDGYGRIMQSRTLVSTSGGRVLAPCPHADACPLLPGDWCHFGTRIARSQVHRTVKSAELGFEDEPYSYVAFDVDEEGLAPLRRVIRRPRKSKGYVELSLCGPEGLAPTVITRSNSRYREARNVHWGGELT